MFLHNRWNGGLRDGSKFRRGWGWVGAAGRHGFYLRYDVLVSSAASRLLSFLVCGVWVQVPFDASESRHELLSESAWPDACTLWARWHIPAETGRLVAAARLWWMWRRWQTEGRSGEQLVCAHTRPAAASLGITACPETHLNLSYSCVYIPYEVMQKQSFTSISADYQNCTLCSVFSISYISYREMLIIKWSRNKHTPTEFLVTRHLWWNTVPTVTCTSYMCSLLHWKYTDNTLLLPPTVEDWSHWSLEFGCRHHHVQPESTWWLSVAAIWRSHPQGSSQRLRCSRAIWLKKNT